MLELTVRSTAVLIFAWTLVRLMPRATAATRHLVWHGAMVAVVAIAALSPLADARLVPTVPVVPAVPVPMAQVIDIIQTSASHPLTMAAAEGRRTATGPAVIDLLTLAHLGTLGTLAVSLWFALGWIAAIRLSRRATPAPAAWQLEVNALCERLRIQREVRVKVIEQQSSPVATGVWRAAILLPRTAMAWSDDRRRSVLLHELAHIRRRDCRVQAISQIACALYWFNPLVWMAASALRRERERACDDQVLSCGARASSYAAHLLDIARELRPSVRPSAALAMARPSDLEGRLLAVLAARQARVPLRLTRWVVVTVMTIATAAALGATSRAAQVPSLSSLAIANAESYYVVSNDIVATSQPTPTPRAEAEATLQSSDDAQDREHATLALAFTSGRDVIPALLRALADPDAQVREKAAIGLELRRDARIIEPLIAAMSDPDAQVREKVAIALGASGDARAQDALTKALADPDAQVREKAASALILYGLTR